MTPLRIIVLSALVVLVISISRSFSVSSSPEDRTSETATNEQRHITQLTRVCHATWQQYDWQIGEHGTLARENIAFDSGIQRVCQARAELFFEGYELSPFIDPDAQSSIFPIVFIPNVDELKSVIRQNLPALRVI
jgi:hypothetical protein